MVASKTRRQEPRLPSSPAARRTRGAQHQGAVVARTQEEKEEEEALASWLEEATPYGSGGSAKNLT